MVCSTAMTGVILGDLAHIKDYLIGKHGVKPGFSLCNPEAWQLLAAELQVHAFLYYPTVYYCLISILLAQDVN